MNFWLGVDDEPEEFISVIDLHGAHAIELMGILLGMAIRI
ncbi:hypothetical protein AM1_C0248 (plasmid) [Acaryochloris marina MBIC11017]|uniref:Uncharacterized protein n=1 Tax=Acaryochloris marina (strain MBIC 11017) TaxID=329726 RepID=A8ZMY1_ACAM1|nr:hypothetical protein AM1_C0248 [Acaryochloris marina MBIC11017]